jgi:hypothetical protein
MSETDDKALVAQILSSYLSNNTVAANDLPSVIEAVKRAFGGSADSITPRQRCNEEVAACGSYKKIDLPRRADLFMLWRKIQIAQAALANGASALATGVSSRLRSKERLSYRCSRLRRAPLRFGEVPWIGTETGAEARD